MGQISWRNSLPSGICKPAPCVGRKVNELPGPDCRCKDGYDGEPELVDGKALNDHNCIPAECKILNSVKKGPRCKCHPGFQGNISWSKNVASGTCEAAPCEVANSNMKPGRRCKCLPKYFGEIRWRGSRPKGECKPVACLGKHVNKVPGPGCRCKNGYNGHVRLSHKSAFKFDSRGFGSNQGSSSRMLGKCEPAPCTIVNSNLKAGPDCQCKAFFLGKIEWNGSVAQGKCTPAPCNIPNSNMEPGPQCDCHFGFENFIEWSAVEQKVGGACYPLRCVGAHVNGVSGPGCNCTDGYHGTVQPRDATPDDFAVDASTTMVLEGDCQPAPCNIENSNRVPAFGCKCLDGYFGEIVWTGPVAKGKCRPMPCNIANSNRKDGPECRCLDGYYGTILWKGEEPLGTCAAVPCKVPNSDFAAGADCQCLPGFYGQIKWNGNKTKGECLPQPACSSHVVHVTWLKARLRDSKGHKCQAGEQLVFYGHVCDTNLHKIQWTSARSQGAGRHVFRLGHC